MGPQLIDLSCSSTCKKNCEYLIEKEVNLDILQLCDRAIARYLESRGIRILKDTDGKVVEAISDYSLLYHAVFAVRNHQRSEDCRNGHKMEFYDGTGSYLCSFCSKKIKPLSGFYFCSPCYLNLCLDCMNSGLAGKQGEIELILAKLKNLQI